MNFNLQQFCVSIDKSKPYSQIYLQIIARCTNLQLLIVVMKKSILLEMHHHETYMYINFQQIRVNRSVIIVHINVFAKKNRKLHKFATTNSIFFLKTDSFRHASS